MRHNLARAYPTQLPCDKQPSNLRMMPSLILVLVPPKELAVCN